MKAVYAACLTRKEEGGFRAVVPDVPGCVTSGADRAGGRGPDRRAGCQGLRGEMKNDQKELNPTAALVTGFVRQSFFSAGFTILSKIRTVCSIVALEPLAMPKNS